MNLRPSTAFTKKIAYYEKLRKEPSNGTNYQNFLKIRIGSQGYPPLASPSLQRSRQALETISGIIEDQDLEFFGVAYCPETDSVGYRFRPNTERNPMGWRYR